MNRIKTFFRKLTGTHKELPVFSVERSSKDAIKVNIENRKGRGVEVYTSHSIDGKYVYAGLMNEDVFYLSKAKRIKLSFINGMKSLAKYL